jgi:hypothetical protein
MTESGAGETDKFVGNGALKMDRFLSSSGNRRK